MQIIDIDAFASPQFIKLVRVGGAEYGILSPIDLTNQQYTDLVSLDERIRQFEGSERQVGEIKRLIAVFMPEITPEVMDRIPYRKLGALVEVIRQTIAEHTAKEPANPLAPAPSA